MKYIKINKLYLVNIGVIINIKEDKFQYYVFPYKFYCTRKKLLFKNSYKYKLLTGDMQLYDNPEYCKNIGDYFICNYIDHKKYNEIFDDDKISLNDLKQAEYFINHYKGL